MGRGHLSGKGDFKRPPTEAAELEMLSSFLDFHRDALLRNVAGVPDEDLRRPMVPSGVSLLGLVKHLTIVEIGWFQKTFEGRQVEWPFTLAADDPDADFRVEPRETTQDIIDAYKRACDQNREIVAAAQPEDHAHRAERADYTLRWILTHMIEETARHNGHADILREMIDGTVGE